MYWIIGTAGIIGALLRYFIGILFPANNFWGFPLETLFVNYIGCFFISWFSIWSTKVKSISEPIRMGISNGLIGSFTTFSAFSVEVVEMFYNGLWIMALFYVFLSLWGGFAIAKFGFQLAARKKINER